MLNRKIFSKTIILAAAYCCVSPVFQESSAGIAYSAVVSASSSSVANDQQNQEFEKSLKALREGDADQKYGAIIALGRSDNPAAVEPLINELGNPDVFVRSFAAVALGNLKDTRAIDPLIKALGDENQRVRRSAAEALSVFKDPKTLDPLIKLMSDPNILVRRSAAMALGNIGTPKAVAPLMKALGDEDEYIADGASAALLLVGKSCIPELVNVLGDWTLGPRAAEILQNFSWQPASQEEKVRFYVATRDRKALIQDWGNTQKILMADASSANARQSENAVYALIGLGQDASLEELATLLRTKGNSEMARAFAESGNARLTELAQNWAKEHGSPIQTRDGDDIVKWGGMTSQ